MMFKDLMQNQPNPLISFHNLLDVNANALEQHAEVEARSYSSSLAQISEVISKTKAISEELPEYAAYQEPLVIAPIEAEKVEVENDYEGKMADLDAVYQKFGDKVKNDKKALLDELQVEKDKLQLIKDDYTTSRVLQEKSQQETDQIYLEINSILAARAEKEEEQLKLQHQREQEEEMKLEEEERRQQKLEAEIQQEEQLEQEQQRLKLREAKLAAERAREAEAEELRQKAKEKKLVEEAEKEEKRLKKIQEKLDAEQARKEEIERIKQMRAERELELEAKRLGSTELAGEKVNASQQQQVEKESEAPVEQVPSVPPPSADAAQQPAQKEPEALSEEEIKKQEQLRKIEERMKERAMKQSHQ